MGALLSLLALLALAVPASAGTDSRVVVIDAVQHARYQNLGIDGAKYRTLDPPAKWLEKPYDGTVVVLEKEPEYIGSLCKTASGKKENEACAFPGWPSPDICAILIAPHIVGEEREVIVRHELAHCTGWPADHPLD